MPVTAAGRLRARRAWIPACAPSRATAAVALALLAGCAHAPAPLPIAGPPPPPERPRVAPGYDGRLDSLDAVDPAVLRGRRIVLDPGHGGFFPGCIGVGGTTEAEVNLGVALRLQALLESRGALVLMTRTTDRDYLVPADSSLRRDLTERVRLANAFGPDLFLSIHHNADPGGSHDVNETQTYYQLSDDGPAYDAGTDVHRSLVRNLGIATHQLLPGNFAVVRGSAAPALLTEASYLTDPDVEARLRTPGGQELEAEALYLGLARFFARHAPVIAAFAGEDGDGRAMDSLVTTRSLTLRARVEGTFDGLRLRLDGEDLPVTITGDRIEARPAGPLANGPHEVTLVARLAAEGASRVARLRFEMAKPVRRLLAETPWQPAWNGHGALAVRVRLLDEDGLAVPGEARVRLHVAGPPGVAPADTVLTARDGAAWGVLRARRPLRAGSLALAARLDGARAPGAATLAVAIRPGATAVRVGLAVRMPAATPLTDVPGTGGVRPALDWLSPSGLARARADSDGVVHAPRLAGFRPWGRDSLFPYRYTALAGGALQGRRIVLDPEGGGDDAAGLGASGSRGASFNLDVARALGALLEAAGAQVAYTRQGDAPVSEVERVQIGEAFRADRYLRIAHAAAPPVAGHYFASAIGRRWGGALAAACARLGLGDSLPVHELSRYPLAQSSAAALYASIARIDDPLAEARLLAPGGLRLEAWALFAALVDDLRGAPSPAESLSVSAGGQPVPGALVTLGGALVAQCDGRGVARFVRTEEGPLEVLVQDPRVRVRALLLDSEHGRALAGPR